LIRFLGRLADLANAASWISGMERLASALGFQRELALRPCLQRLIDPARRRELPFPQTKKDWPDQSNARGFAGLGRAQ
jgi:hypothetical protein